MQEHFCPEGVVVACVTGISWLTFFKPQHFLQLDGKTDFVFINLNNAPKWLTPRMRITDKSELE